MSSKELRKTFTPNYFSLEDILASHTKVPCQTTVTFANFGFLDASQESENLPAGSLVELPLWAARAMSKQKRQSFVSVKLPKYFNDNFREILKADPAVVDLHKMGPHYYQAGLQICTLPNDDAELISEILPEVLQRRVMAMLDAYSLHREHKTTDDKISGEGGGILKHNYMDPLELHLFHDSKVASDQLDEWLRRNHRHNSDITNRDIIVTFDEFGLVLNRECQITNPDMVVLSDDKNLEKFPSPRMKETKNKCKESQLESQVIRT